MASGDLVTRIYGPFRGVDFRGKEINISRSPDSLNMWKDYTEVESIRTRPGLELQHDFENKIYGIFVYKVNDREMLLVHSGTKLYKLEAGEREVVYEGLNPLQSQSFIFNEKFFFKDGLNYLVYDGETAEEVIGYVPTTSIARRPLGGGSIYQDVNILSSFRKNSFLADGKEKEYHLDAQKIDEDYVPEITVNGELVTTFTFNPAEGVIKFDTAPPEPYTDGQDNVVIKFRKTVPEHQNMIKRCTLLESFDNRIFFAGNQNYPNTLWHSSLNDPSYCSDQDYYVEGMDLSRIKSIVAGNDALIVLKEPSQAKTSIFLHQPIVDGEYGKIYPTIQSNIATGCVGSGINFNDDIVFFSERGLEGLNGEITKEKAVAHRSTLVDTKLVKEPRYQDMQLVEWNGYLLAFIDNKVYLADSRAMFSNVDHYEYEWFYWELEKEVICAKVINGMLYIGAEDGIYTLTDHEAAVESFWTTPIDRFDNYQFLKTTNKKGCVVEATGNINIYVKTNDSEWEPVGKYESIEDYFVGRIKKKKFKDLQIKFFSNKRFSLERVSLECYVGGYIKR